MSESRCPKDLREMLKSSEHSQSSGEGVKIGESVIEELSKLHGLSHDDKTENAMLRSRIDEQCELIMILKQRADDASTKLSTSERIRSVLEEFRANAQSEMDNEVKKSEMLESRFNELADNHQELIKFKDQYKTENQYLREENAKLKKDNEELFSGALQEKQAIISDLEKEIGIIKGRVINADQRASDSHKSMIETRKILTERLENTEEGLNATIEALRRQLAASENKLKEVTSRNKADQNRIDVLQSDSKGKLETLSKEKEDLLALVMKRGKLIEEKGVELRTMEQRLQEAKKRQKEAEDRFDKEAAAVDGNIQVAKLRRELSDAHDHVSDIDKKFEAYKNHTNKLLQQERDLNAKLRHLAG